MVEFNGPTEGEMRSFSEILAKMQNAIIAGSQLAQDFAALKVEVEGLRQSVERTRTANTALDEALSVSRQARDRLGDELSVTRSELARVQGEKDAALSDLQTGRERIVELSASLTTARAERDTAQFRVMELEEEAAKSTAFIKSITERLELVYATLHPAASQPMTLKEADELVKPEPADIPQQEGETTGQYFDRVGRYPSEREARAAAQPRSEGGQFAQERQAAASPKWDGEEGYNL